MLHVAVILSRVAGQQLCIPLFPPAHPQPSRPTHLKAVFYLVRSQSINCCYGECARAPYQPTRSKVSPRTAVYDINLEKAVDFHRALRQRTFSLYSPTLPPDMSRRGTLRTWGGSNRGSTAIARLVKTTRAPRASSTSNRWLAQNWGLLVTAAATLSTIPCFMGTTNYPRSGAMSSPASVGHQSLFASPKSRGGISIAQQQPSGWSTGRALQEEETVATPIVEYDTKLQLFMCNPTMVEDGGDAYLVDEDRLAAALSKVSGLLQVSHSTSVSAAVHARLNTAHHKHYANKEQTHLPLFRKSRASPQGNFFHTVCPLSVYLTDVLYEHDLPEARCWVLYA